MLGFVFASCRPSLKNMAAIPISAVFVRHMTKTKPKEKTIGGVKTDQMAASLSKYCVLDLGGAEVFARVCDQLKRYNNEKGATYQVRYVRFHLSSAN